MWGSGSSSPKKPWKTCKKNYSSGKRGNLAIWLWKTWVEINGFYLNIKDPGCEYQASLTGKRSSSTSCLLCRQRNSKVVINSDATVDKNEFKHSMQPVEQPSVNNHLWTTICEQPSDYWKEITNRNTIITTIWLLERNHK